MQQIFQAVPKTRDNLQIDFQIIPFSLMNTNNESRHQRVRVKKIEAPTMDASIR